MTSVRCRSDPAYVYLGVNVRVQIKIWLDLKICWLKIKLGFLTEEIKIVTSAGRILNHASIDCNFNTYWDKFLFSSANFSQSDFKLYSLESISLMIQIKISPGRTQNCNLYWHDLKSYQQKL